VLPPALLPLSVLVILLGVALRCSHCRNIVHEGMPCCLYWEPTQSPCFMYMTSMASFITSCTEECSPDSRGPRPPGQALTSVLSSSPGTAVLSQQEKYVVVPLSPLSPAHPCHIGHGCIHVAVPTPTRHLFHLLFCFKSGASTCGWRRTRPALSASRRWSRRRMRRRERGRDSWDPRPLR